MAENPPPKSLFLGVDLVSMPWDADRCNEMREACILSALTGKKKIERGRSGFGRTREASNFGEDQAFHEDLDSAVPPKPRPEALDSETTKFSEEKDNKEFSEDLDSAVPPQPRSATSDSETRKFFEEKPSYESFLRYRIPKKNSPETSHSEAQKRPLPDDSEDDMIIDYEGLSSSKIPEKQKRRRFMDKKARRNKEKQKSPELPRSILIDGCDLGYEGEDDDLGLQGVEEFEEGGQQSSFLDPVPDAIPTEKGPAFIPLKTKAFVYSCPVYSPPTMRQEGIQKKSAADAISADGAEKSNEVDYADVDSGHQEFTKRNIEHHSGEDHQNTSSFPDLVFATQGRLNFDKFKTKWVPSAPVSTPPPKKPRGILKSAENDSNSTEMAAKSKQNFGGGESTKTSHGAPDEEMIFFPYGAKKKRPVAFTTAFESIAIIQEATTATPAARDLKKNSSDVIAIDDDLLQYDAIANDGGNSDSVVATSPVISSLPPHEPSGIQERSDNDEIRKENSDGVGCHGGQNDSTNTHRAGIMKDSQKVEETVFFRYGGKKKRPVAFTTVFESTATLQKATVTPAKCDLKAATSDVIVIDADPPQPDSTTKYVGNSDSRFEETIFYGAKKKRKIAFTTPLESAAMLMKARATPANRGLEATTSKLFSTRTESAMKQQGSSSATIRGGNLKETSPDVQIIENPAGSRNIIVLDDENSEVLDRRAKAAVVPNCESTKL